MNKFFKAATAAAALIGAMASAQAQNVTITKFAPSPVDVYVLASTDAGVHYSGVVAQELDVTLSTGKTFAAYCIEVLTARGAAPSTYKVKAEAYTDIAKLFAVAGFDSNKFLTDAVDTGAEKAGLQLAIWEAIDDGFADVGQSISAFSLGDFRAKGASTAANNAAFAQASLYLTQAKSLTTGYQSYVNVLYSTMDPARQNLVTSVPEPTTYALMAACLGVVAFVSRRKQQA